MRRARCRTDRAACEAACVERRLIPCQTRSRILKKCTIPGAFALLILAAPVAAQWNASRADSHAPIGVMADHRHEAGEVMLSYRYMTMTMEGSRIGTDPIADADIVSPGGGFMITPTRMPMTMHMFGAMFAPSDRVTFMAMLPFVSSSMDHITRHGGSFTTESGGLGDVKVGAMIGLADWANQSLHLNAMLARSADRIDRGERCPSHQSGDGGPAPLPHADRVRHVRPAPRPHLAGPGRRLVLGRPGERRAAHRHERPRLGARRQGAGDRMVGAGRWAATLRPPCAWSLRGRATSTGGTPRPA